MNDTTEANYIDRIKRLPCWRGTVTLQPLAGGLSNRNYLVKDGAEKYVARAGGDAPIHNVMRFNEHACAHAAAAAGIAPQLLYTEPDMQVIPFIEGTVFDDAMVRDHIARILLPLKTLHHAGTRALRGPVLGFSVFHVLRHYQKLLNENDCRRAARLPLLLEQAEQLETAVGAIEPALCHNDLLAANFIDDGNKVHIIDWEHAGLNTPLFDLANIASNNLFPTPLEHKMLTLYYDTPPTPTLWKRYKAFRAASHQRETLWSMISEIYSEIDEDYVTYTDKNLDECDEAYAEFEEA